MKLQQLVYKVEELKSLVSVFEQTQQGLAQAKAIQDTIVNEADEEQKTKIADTVAQMTARLAAVEKLLVERTSASDVDDAVDRVQAHIARLQQYQQTRGEQLQLRTQLDLELAIGQVPAETRQQAESSLEAMQLRMEMLVKQGHDAFPRPVLVTL